jgi:hypothetical protein
MPIHARVVLLLILPVLSAAGCVVVPRIDGAANVSLDDVAWRVKCDIWKVVARKMHEFPTDKHHRRSNPYSFLAGWGAKVHLTLAVDNTGALNPGATLIQPLPASQSRSLGLGAGISTEAISTTDYEFFMSFSELDKEYKRAFDRIEKYCPAPEGLLLESDLHIDDLFDRALEPVKYGTLRVGQHPGFGGSSTPVTPADQVPDYTKLEKIFSELRAKPSEGKSLRPEDFKFIQENLKLKGLLVPPNEVLETQHTIEDNKQIALQLETKAQTYINNIVKPVTDILGASFPACVKTVTQLRNEAIIQAALVSSDKIDVDRATTAAASTASLNALREQLMGSKSKNKKGLEETVEEVLNELKTCPLLRTPAAPPQLYDPLDLISQTMNFYITSSGSITPTWKLVRVSAPLAGTFASASRKDTNTLIIAFGRPDLSKNGGGNTAVSNQILTSTLKDALGPRLAP